MSGEGSANEVIRLLSDLLRELPFTDYTTLAYDLMISKKCGDICIAVLYPKVSGDASPPVICGVYAYGSCIASVTPAVIRLLSITITDFVFGLQPEMTSRV